MFVFVFDVFVFATQTLCLKTLRSKRTRPPEYVFVASTLTTTARRAPEDILNDGAGREPPAEGAPEASGACASTKGSAERRQARKDPREDFTRGRKIPP